MKIWIEREGAGMYEARSNYDTGVSKKRHMADIGKSIQCSLRSSKEHLWRTGKLRSRSR